MRLYVKAEYQAAINLFRTYNTDRFAKAEAAMDAITAHNAAISARLYINIKEGATAYQKHTGGRRMDIYHMSTRTPGLIQVSRFCLFNGQWEALSHGEVTSPKKIYNELRKGCYVTVRT